MNSNIVKSRTSVFSVVIGFAALVSTAGAQAKDFYQFSHFQINAPFNISQEPIRANILSNKGKEIILIGEKQGAPRLAIFAFNEGEQTYQLNLDIALPKSYFSFDVSDESEAGQQSLYFLSSEHVVLFSPENANPFTDIVDIRSIYVNHNASYLKQADFVTDLNNDGLNDVLLADFRSLNIYLNQSDSENLNRYSKQALPIEPTVEIFTRRVSYTERPYYLVDMNLDSKQDIVITGDGELLVFSQTDQGSFATEPETLAVNDDIKGINWWDSRGADGDNIDQSDFSYKTVQYLKDLNDDNLPDMVVKHTKSSGVLDKSNDYEVYLGKAVDGVLTYADKPNTTVRSDGTLAQLDFIDINGDNKHEVMASSFDISVSQIIGALLTGSIDQQILIFSLDQQQIYRQRFTEEVQLKFSLSSGKSGSPVIELADLDGDGLKELIISDADNQLKIFPGKKQSTLLQSKYQYLDVRLPKDGSLLTSDDLNLDGKEELIVRYSSEDGGNKQSRLLIIQVE